MTTLDELAAFRARRSRWVLGLAGLELGVLAAGLTTAVMTGFVAFAALAAAWMFVSVRISRGVIGNRVGDEEARRATARLALLGEPQEGIPTEVLDAAAHAREHRMAALALSAGAIAALGVGGLSAPAPAVGPWAFGIAVLYISIALGWAWSKRTEWASARALLDAWLARHQG